jgi:hypothetical protein
MKMSHVKLRLEHILLYAVDYSGKAIFKDGCAYKNNKIIIKIQIIF